jgi:hypothetical protein
VCHAERVHLHHRTYDRLGCEDLRDLIPLCEACHSATHEWQKRNGGGLWTAHRRYASHVYKGMGRDNPRKQDNALKPWPTERLQALAKTYCRTEHP